MDAEQADRCQECGAALEARQRYCLACGARVGPRSPELRALLSRGGRSGEGAHGGHANGGDADGAGGGALAPDAGAAAGGRPGGAARARSLAARAAAAFVPLSALRLPSRRISAVLVLAFLGFGVVLGKAAGTAPNGSLAASRQPLRVLLPASGAGTANAAEAPAPEAEGGAASAEEAHAPEAEAQATPESSSGAGATQKPASKPGATPSKPGKGRRGEHAASAPAAPATRLPPLRHVFVIMLSDAAYAQSFGPASAAPYLARTLERQGLLLPRYDAVAHQQLANEIALVSGQGPTAETAANCPTYAAISPATPAAEEQVLGAGCLYPPATQTLAGQLAAKSLRWRAYIEGTDEGAPTPPACAHPAPGAADPTASPPAAGESYATFSDPFVYFQSVTGSPACASQVVGLAQLSGDLASASRTPNFSYIAPDLCHDGSPVPCRPGSPAGLAAAGSFLSRVVPRITGSPAYKHDGLLVITTDEAPTSGEFADSSACCEQPQFPNLPAPPAGLSPRGGGNVGALLLSPYIKGGTTSEEPYNHFSLLRTVEDLFGLAHLGYAALPKVAPLEPGVFLSKPAG